MYLEELELTQLEMPVTVRKTLLFSPNSYPDCVSA